MFDDIEFCIQAMADRRSPITGEVAPCDTKTSERARAEVAYIKNVLESWRTEEAEWKSENDRYRMALERIENLLPDESGDSFGIAHAALNPKP